MRRTSRSRRQRAYSIRTRIKTDFLARLPLGECKGQRAYSIRTRIKTVLVEVKAALEVIVREHIPLEQGLRLCFDVSSRGYLLSVREHIPLEQGLRHYILLLIFSFFFFCQRAYSIRTRIKTFSLNPLASHTENVREHIPLEQGLRQPSSLHNPRRRHVREHIPLEQGLRLGSVVVVLREPKSESIFH